MKKCIKIVIMMSIVMSSIVSKAGESWLGWFWNGGSEVHSNRSNHYYSNPKNQQNNFYTSNGNNSIRNTFIHGNVTQDGKTTHVNGYYVDDQTDAIRGSGKDATKKYPTGKFTAIHVPFGEVRFTNRKDVAITGDNNIVKEINVKNKNKKLSIDFTDHDHFIIDRKPPLSIEVPNTYLETTGKISISGGSSCDCGSICDLGTVTTKKDFSLDVQGKHTIKGTIDRAEDIYITAQGTNNLNIAINNARNVITNLSGSTNLTLKGVAQTLQSVVFGSSTLKAKKLIVDIAKVEAMGASHADVYAAKKMESRASGASNITCYGPFAKWIKEKLGASSVCRG